MTGPRGPGKRSTLMPVSGVPSSSKPSVKRVVAFQSARGAAVAVEEPLRGRGVLGDDRGGEPGGLVVRDPRAPRRRRPTSATVIVATRSGSEAHSCPSGRSSGRPPCAPGRTSMPELGADARRSTASAGAERSTSARLSRLQTPRRSRLARATLRQTLRRGGLVRVEDAAALGVRERPHAVCRRGAGERGRRGAAAAQDHEREHAGERDERLGAGVVGRAHEARPPLRRRRRRRARAAAPGRRAP